jgi:hypothetical protein
MMSTVGWRGRGSGLRAERFQTGSKMLAVLRPRQSAASPFGRGTYIIAS